MRWSLPSAFMVQMSLNGQLPVLRSARTNAILPLLPGKAACVPAGAPVTVNRTDAISRTRDLPNPRRPASLKRAMRAPRLC